MAQSNTEIYFKKMIKFFIILFPCEDTHLYAVNFFFHLFAQSNVEAGQAQVHKSDRKK